MTVLRNVYDDDNEWVLLHVLGCHLSSMEMFTYSIVFAGWGWLGLGVPETKEPPGQCGHLL